MSESVPFANDYPRPHLRREAWTNLNGIWALTFTGLRDPMPETFDRRIRVPYPVESYLSGIEERVDPRRLIWYQRTFRLTSPNDRIPESIVLLHFEKVDYETIVFVNGRQVGPKHAGGYDPFSYDITPFIFDDEENVILVRVWDPSQYSYQARGKQMLDADRGDFIYYTPCSGIWGTVWLEEIPAVHIERARFSSKLSTTDVHLTLRVDLSSDEENAQNDRKEAELLEASHEEKAAKLSGATDKQSHRLRIVILRSTGEQLIEFFTNRTDADQELTLPLSDISLWSPETPILYDVNIYLYQMDTLIERVDTYLAFREVSLCSRKKKKICLNGKPYFMFGVLDQGYWPDGLYRAPSDEAYQFDIKQMKDLGFNTLRKHMKTETSRWYYWCDVLGMLVWQDMIAGDSFRGYEEELEQDKQLRQHRDNRTNNLPTERARLQNDDDDERPPKSSRNYRSKLQFERELKAMIDFLSFHPSIVIWVLFNEAWGQYDTIRLTTWLEYYDPSRLIDAASGWHDRVGGGHMRDVHDYTMKILLPQIDDHRRALVLGECGGFGLTTSGQSYNSFSDRYFLTYAFEQLIIHRSTRLSALIYTQLSDVENESNGIFTYNRREQKLIGSHVRRVLQDDHSGLYKLQNIFNITTRPRTKFLHLAFSQSFYVNLTSTSSDSPQFYFHTCYLHSVVDITIDQKHTMILNQTDVIKDYHYVSIPSDLFRHSDSRLHSLDIVVRYSPLVTNDQQSLTYINSTYFYLSVVMLSES